jgi:hypothetical protein
MRALRKPIRKREAKIMELNASGKTPLTSKERFVRASWITAHSIFWNGQIFCKTEKDEFKQLIAQHFDERSTSKENFRDLVQRFCLAKRYVTRNERRYIGRPANWLNIHYPNGLVGTEQWLLDVKQQRETVPHYNEGIATLARGLQLYVNTPCALIFRHYRRLLIEQKQFDLLQIFYNTVLNLQYSY